MQKKSRTVRLTRANAYADVERVAYAYVYVAAVFTCAHMHACAHACACACAYALVKASFQSRHS